MQAVVAALLIAKDQRRRPASVRERRRLSEIRRAKLDTNRASASAQPIDSPSPPTRDTSRRADPRPAAASGARNTCTRRRRSDGVPSRRGCESDRDPGRARSTRRTRLRAIPRPSSHSLARRDRARFAPSPAPQRDRRWTRQSYAYAALARTNSPIFSIACCPSSSIGAKAWKT